MEIVDINTERSDPAFISADAMPKEELDGTFEGPYLQLIRG